MSAIEATFETNLEAYLRGQMKKGKTPLKYVSDFKGQATLRVVKLVSAGKMGKAKAAHSEANVQLQEQPVPESMPILESFTRMHDSKVFKEQREAPIGQDGQVLDLSNCKVKLAVLCKMTQPDGNTHSYYKPLKVRSEYFSLYVSLPGNNHEDKKRQLAATYCLNAGLYDQIPSEGRRVLVQQATASLALVPEPFSQPTSCTSTAINEVPRGSASESEVLGSGQVGSVGLNDIFKSFGVGVAEAGGSVIFNMPGSDTKFTTNVTNTQGGNITNTQGGTHHNNNSGGGGHGGGGSGATAEEDDAAARRHDETQRELKGMKEQLSTMENTLQQQPQETAHHVSEVVGDQLQQSSLKVQADVQTAMKQFTNRNPRYSGEFAGRILADDFAENPSSPQRARDGDDAEEDLLKELLAAKSAREIVTAIMGVSRTETGDSGAGDSGTGDSGTDDVSLLNGVKEHIENLLLLLRDIQGGLAHIPQVESRGLDVLMEGNEGEKLCACMHDKVYLHKGCFVLATQNDYGEEVEFEFGSEVLAGQRTAVTSTSSFELSYKDKNEVVVEFNSALQDDSTAAVNFVFNKICSEQDLVKVVVNGNENRKCMLETSSIEASAYSKDFILQFHKCNLSHLQARALAGSQCTLILDHCDIKGLEETLFGDVDVNTGMKVGFLNHCPKFKNLIKAVESGRVKVLLFQKIDLSNVEMYGDDSNEAMSQLEEIIHAATVSQCVICFGEMKYGSESLPPNSIDSSLVVAENESINLVHELGNNVVQSKVLFEDKKGRTITLLQDGILLFTNYQEEPFTLKVGETKSLQECDVELLDTGRLRYTFADGHSLLRTLPLTSTPDKFWCRTCASPRKKCPSHLVQGK